MKKKAQEKAVKAKRGRKPATDPKVQVCFWVNSSFVEAAGGMIECREKCIEFVTKLSTNKNKQDESNQG